MPTGAPEVYIDQDVIDGTNCRYRGNKPSIARKKYQIIKVVKVLEINFSLKALGNYTKVLTDELKAVKLKVLPANDCEKILLDFKNKINETNPDLLPAWKPFLKDYEICVEAEEKSHCKGDSGGPFVCKGQLFLKNLESEIIFTTLIHKYSPWPF